jgi:hypothetical protein
VHEVTASQATALRAGADLAELVAEKIRPDLLAGSVVLTNGFVDELVVRYGVQSGMGEERVLRLAQWAVGGLRPDLTILVDVPARAGLPDVPDRSIPDGSTPSGSAPAEVPGLAVRQEAARLEALSETEPFALVDTAPELVEDRLEHEEEGAGEPATDPASAFLDRASAASERYLVVSPLSQASAVLSPDVVERIASVLRGRSPVRLDQANPQTGSPDAAPVDPAPHDDGRPAATMAGAGTQGPQDGTQAEAEWQSKGEPQSEADRHHAAPQSAPSAMMSVADGLPEGAR